MTTDTTLPAAPPSSSFPAVQIRVAGDDDAQRVCAVLEALGYRVTRDLGEHDGPERLAWAVARLARAHALTKRERDILALVLDGLNNDAVSRELGITRATVKWHMHNLFAKTNTSNRESLLRLALQLGGARPPKGSEPDAPAPLEAEIVTQAHEVEKDPIPAAAVPSKAWF